MAEGEVPLEPNSWLPDADPVAHSYVSVLCCPTPVGVDFAVRLLLPHSVPQLTKFFDWVSEE